MAVFQPVDVAGPAHRGGQMQKLALTAAQNVMRRQRMRALIQQGSRVGGAAHPTQASAHARPPGHQMQQPMVGGNSFAQYLASLQQSSGERANAPGMSDGGGMYNGPGYGGGFDFNSIPDPTDPHQSPQTLPPQYTPPSGGVNAPVAPPNSVGNLANDGFIQPGADKPGGPVTSGTGPPPAGSFAYDGPSDPSASGGTVNGLIPLGGGRFYDPSTDSIHGGQ